MRRVLGIVFALCVLCTGVAATPIGASSAPAAPSASVASSAPSSPPAALPVVTANNTTNYLDLNRTSVVRADFHRADFDVSAALSADSTAVAGRLQVDALDVAFRNATTADARRAVLRRYVKHLENETARLRARERQALSAFNAGERSASQYLRTLAQIDAEAERLERVVGRLDELADRVREPSISVRRLNTIQSDLFALDGPVREHLVSVASGDAPPTRVLLESSDTGVLLSTIVTRDGQPMYVRETYLGDVRRTSTGADRYRGLDEAYDRARELYPWAADRNLGGAFGFAEVYRITFVHPQGELTTFIDGQSGKVFREYQHKELPGVPLPHSTGNVTDELNLTVGRTHPGGPMLVRLENAAGEPVNATVTVNDEPVGTTGADGELWTLSSGSKVVAVRATASEGTVTAVVQGTSSNATG
ncbi:DUF7096 domain-containing protein [Halomarina pelagica]|uniref:DUF7096 domain-containing protein n=1 Tax=Halomarina pelagica TaxID=2961599 RepID=UPI0020C40492|nr:hypothetical protein [Halomarina sp. BND7]